MQFTGRHSALVEHCLPTVTGGGYNCLDSDELTKKIAEEVSLRVP